MAEAELYYVRHCTNSDYEKILAAKASIPILLFLEVFHDQL